MPVRLALTPDTRRTDDVAALVDAARAAGFAALGLSAAQVPGAGMPCHELLALVVGDDERATLTATAELAEAASVVGAEWVLAVFRCVPPARTMREVATRLADAGTGLAVEFSPLGPVASLEAGLRLVDAAADGGRAGLVVDTWHVCRGPTTWDDLGTVPLDLIAYVQFTDAPPPVSDDGMAETMERRALPGDGELDLERFAGVLLDRGWQGTVSVEVLNRAWRARPIDEFARMAHDRTAPYWSLT